jgi:hypothetical protein
MTRLFALTAALLMLAALPAPVLAATTGGSGPVPRKIGACVETSLKLIATRLEGVPDSGSLVIYRNGIVGVDYDTIKPITRAKVGDRITLCLTSIPGDCPPGDNRGRTYSAVDHRTGGKWELHDAEHMCGGA